MIIVVTDTIISISIIEYPAEHLYRLFLISVFLPSASPTIELDWVDDQRACRDLNAIESRGQFGRLFRL